MRPRNLSPRTRASWETDGHGSGHSFRPGAGAAVPRRADCGRAGPVEHHHHCVLLIRLDVVGGAATVHRLAELHAAGDPVLYSCLVVHVYRRGGAAHHPLRHCGCRAFPRRSRHGFRACLHAVCCPVRLLASDRGCHRHHCHRRHAAGGLHQGVRLRRHRQCRHAGHPHSAVHRHGCVLRRHRCIRGPDVPRWRDTRPDRRPDADGGDLYHGPVQEPAVGRMERLRRDPCRRQGSWLGPVPSSSSLAAFMAACSPQPRRLPWPRSTRSSLRCSFIATWGR